MPRGAVRPGEPGGKGGGQGSVMWRLHVVREGAYYLWGRVQAPTLDDDSFYLRVLAGSTEPINTADWHVGTHEKWEWAPVRIDPSEGPTAIVLPADELDIQLRVREDGTKIDRLFVTPDANEEPH